MNLNIPVLLQLKNTTKGLMKNFFSGKAIQSNNIYNLSPLQAQKFCSEGSIIVDVREEYLNRFKIFDVPGLIFCPLKLLPGLIKQLPADKPLIFADAVEFIAPKLLKQ